MFSKVYEELHRSVSTLNAQPVSYLASPLEGKALESVLERSKRVLVRRAHQEDFIALEALGRVKLSKETRKAELKRLKRKYKKRKKYTFRYGRKHNKQKARTKKEYNNRRWEANPLERLKYSLRCPVEISQEDWDRCIKPVWEQYDRKHLKIRHKGRRATIYTMSLIYHPPRERYARQSPKPVVVYDGANQAVYDSMNGCLMAELLE